MNSKKAITITAIAIALTGLITGAIFLAKKTGIKPKIQTNAYDYISNVTKNNDTTTITIEGTETQYENDTINFKYQITQNENGYNIKADYGTTKIAGIRAYRQNQQKINTDIVTNNTELDSIVVYRTSYTINELGNTFVINSQYTTTIRWDSGDEQQHYNWNIITSGTTGTPAQNTNTEVSRLFGIGTTYTNIANYGTYQYQTGYTTGYQTKGDLSDGNFTSIQEVMLNVLTMPFTFISQGFNVTLWEGTPYAINIGNFIKSLIAIATILFIIKMFTSGFTVIGNYTSNRSSTKLDRQQKKANINKTKAETRRQNNLADKGK